MVGERVLEGLGLGVDPEQDRDLTEPAALAAERLNAGRDGRRLGHLVGVTGVAHLRAGRPLGAELDTLALRSREQGVGGRDHLRGGAVVADQLDGGGAGVLGREAREVARVRPGERVDRLRRVADHAQLVATPEPQVEQRRLDRRDVLELVDDEPFVLPADLGRHALVVGEHARGEQEDVFHVHPALAPLDLLVAGEQPSDGLRLEPGHRAPAGDRQGGVVVGMDVADLGPLDLGGEVAQQRLVGVDPLAACGGDQETDLRLGQGRQLGAVDVRPEVAQLPQCRRVEGARLHRLGTEPAQPRTHLPRRPSGERHCQDLGRRVDPGGDAVGDPVGDRPGLARACTRQNTHRTAQRLGNLALLWIERGEQLLRRRHREQTPGRDWLIRQQQRP